MLKHPDAAGLHEMWANLRGDRPVPFRAELDAGRIGAKAPFLAILEYVGPSNFRIRIAGDRLNKWFGMELRGMSALSLLDSDSRNHFQATLNRVTADPAVGVLHGVARGPDGLAPGFEMVLLPMRSDFGRVDRVLVGLWLIDAPGVMHGPLRLEPDTFNVCPILGVADAAADAESDADDAIGRGPREPAAPLRVIESPLTGEDARPQAPMRPETAPAGQVQGDGPGAGTSGPGRRGHLRLVTKP
jgi:hypothetical protein